MTQFLHVYTLGPDTRWLRPFGVCWRRESSWRTLPTPSSQESGWASGSVPRGLGLDSAGHSCPPYAWLLLLPGCCWATGTASLFHRTGCPRWSRGAGRAHGPPPPQGFTPSYGMPTAEARPSASQRPTPSPWTRGRPPMEQRSGGAACRKPHPLGLLGRPSWAGTENVCP